MDAHAPGRTPTPPPLEIEPAAPRAAPADGAGDDDAIESTRGDLTRFLASHRESRSAGTRAILPHVYTELRQLAAARLGREGNGHILQPTALVHEAYLRLVGGDGADGWENRRHFFAAAAEAMRRILIDHARARRRRKRTPDAAALLRSETIDESAERFDDLLALDDALRTLEASDPQKARIVELKFFAGLPHPEIAQVLGISLRTTERQWAFARAWLHDQIEGVGGDRRAEARQEDTP